MRLCQDLLHRHEDTVSTGLARAWMRTRSCLARASMCRYAHVSVCIGMSALASEGRYEPRRGATRPDLEPVLESGDLLVVVLCEETCGCDGEHPRETILRAAPHVRLHAGRSRHAADRSRRASDTGHVAHQTGHVADRISHVTHGTGRHSTEQTSQSGSERTTRRRHGT